MKKIAFFLCFVGTLFSAFTQKSNISGRVVEATKQQPVAYAVVGLLHAADSAIIQSEMTDKEGVFSFQVVPAGRYIVQVFFMGYQEWTSEPIALSKTDIDVGTIVLQPTTEMLQAVEIVFKKPLFEQRLGKTIMNVESHPSAAGDNALELLRKVPGVLVDNSDRISLQGKSGVRIFLDDRDPHLSGEDLINYLKSMPATAIDRVEVIKNPLARYDAAGTAGIINLVTKRNANKGINGSVWANGSYSGSWSTNEGVNLAARIGKWVLNGTFNYMYGDFRSGTSSEQISQSYGDTIRKTINENDDERWTHRNKFSSYGAKFAADYYIDSINSISFSYNGQFYDVIGKSFLYNRLYKNGELFSAFQNRAVGDSKFGNHQLNFNYKHVFDTIGTVVYADVTYSNRHNQQWTDRDYLYFQDDFRTRVDSMRYRNTQWPGFMHVVAAKVDYEHPFNEQVSMECGVKTAYIRNNNNSVNYLNDSLLKGSSNHFIYSENITAAYLQANFQINPKLAIQSGLRAEYTHLEGNLITTGEVNKQDYVDVFPSVQFDYQLPKMHNLSFAYRSRISRPDYSYLNPFITMEDNYTISSGNPHLKPEYTQSLSVDYSWRYMLFVSVGYQFSQGGVSEMMYTDKLTHNKLTRPENVGKTHALDLSFNANVPIGKWWMMMWNVNYMVGKQTFAYETQTTNAVVSSVQLYTMHTFTFCKHYSIEAAAWWMPLQRVTFGKRDGVFFAWAGFKASFCKDALTLRLGVQDIFNRNEWVTNDIYPDGTINNSRWQNQSRSVYLGLSYRFGKQNIQMRHRKAGDTDEFDRMGGGGAAQGGGSNQPK